MGQLRGRLSVAVFGLLLLCPVSLIAQENPRFGPATSRATARLPVVRAEHGMVASKEGHATRIGVDILRRGGNAIDAAVAVGFALAVVSPRSAALGGGGFMLVYLAGEKRTIALDYRETAPADTSSDTFLDANGQPDGAKSRDSGLAVGVPGTVAGLAYAAQHWGSGRLSLADLVAPAVALARDGVPVADDLEDALRDDAGRLSRYPESRKIFFKPDGTALAGGDILIQPDLARTMERIGKEGASAFYTGSVAEAVSRAVRDIGGRMSLEDLASYRVVEREPLRGTYRDREIVGMPPPSSGGVHIIEILNILEGDRLSELGPLSAAAVHRTVEAMKLAYADRAQWIGDPDFEKVPVQGLISKDYAAKLRATIDVARARPSAEIAPGRPPGHESPETTHFSVIDAQGNAVANTYTLNLSFGVGRVADGTGVLLNNELDDFTANPGASNTYGLVGGRNNLPGPRKRPVSSMSPTFMFKDGRLEMVLGSPGGSRIISTVLELITDVVDYGYGLADAVDAPRFHHQWMPDRLAVEPGLSPDTLGLLRQMGHDPVVQNGWGSAMAIARSTSGTLTAAADPRQRGTLAAGY